MADREVCRHCTEGLWGEVVIGGGTIGVAKSPMLELLGRVGALRSPRANGAWGRRPAHLFDGGLKVAAEKGPLQFALVVDGDMAD